MPAVKGLVQHKHATIEAPGVRSVPFVQDHYCFPNVLDMLMFYCSVVELCHVIHVISAVIIYSLSFYANHPSFLPGTTLYV